MLQSRYCATKKACTVAAKASLGVRPLLAIDEQSASVRSSPRLRLLLRRAREYGDRVLQDAEEGYQQRRRLLKAMVSTERHEKEHGVNRTKTVYEHGELSGSCS